MIFARSSLFSIPTVWRSSSVSVKKTVKLICEGIVRSRDFLREKLDSPLPYQKSESVCLGWALSIQFSRSASPPRRNSALKSQESELRLDGSCQLPGGSWNRIHIKKSNIEDFYSLEFTSLEEGRWRALFIDDRTDVRWPQQCEIWWRPEAAHRSGSLRQQEIKIVRQVQRGVHDSRV